MIKTHVIALSVATALLAGCSQYPLRQGLATPKNPHPVLADPDVQRGKEPSFDKVVQPLYAVLLEANCVDNGTTTLRDLSLVKKEDAGTTALGSGRDRCERPEDEASTQRRVRRYIAAGFALSDIYCARFFEKTDAAYRRRRFGRALTNDVGTAVSTLLGLAKAGESIVTGVAASVGLADSSWRNYDDAFVVSPDLSNVQALVFAAQDNYRAATLKPDMIPPADYASAQTVIMRYANFCSYLGMKALLDQSTSQQRNALIIETKDINNPAKTLAGDTSKNTTATPTTTKDGNKKAAPPAPAPAQQPAPTTPTPPTYTTPATALPPIATNAPQ